MPRASGSAPPTEKIKLPAWIHRILRQSTSEAVKLLAQVPARRQVQLRSGSTKLDLSTVTAKLAVAWQQVGVVVTENCATCNADGCEGPFKECVVAPTDIGGHYHMFGRCANCFYSEHEKCSLATTSRARKSYNLPPSQRSSTPTEEKLAALKQTINSMTDEDDDSSLPAKKKIKSSSTQQRGYVQQAIGDFMQITPAPPGPLKSAQEAHSETTLVEKQDLTSASYPILGSLSLPDPKESNLSQPHKDLAEFMRPHLAKLNARDMSLISKSIADLRLEFDTFKVHEPTVWANVNGGVCVPDKALLVEPSGSLDAPVLNHLNQPSDTTRELENAKTLDSTNPCMWLLQGAGFTEKNSLTYDEVVRRDPDSKGIKAYPKAVLAAHRNLSRRIMESAEAKVEIVYGKVVQSYLFEDPQLEYTALPLWGRYDGIILLALLESSFPNSQQDGHLIRRLVLLSPHPQRFFYGKRGAPIFDQQDRMMEAVARMTGIQVTTNYWSERMWHRIPQDMTFIQALPQIRELNRMLNPDLDPVSSLQALKPVSAKEELEFIDSLPPSNDQLRKIIPEATAEAVKAIEREDKWYDVADLPEAVLQWWKCQRLILLQDIDDSTLNEAPILLRRLHGYKFEDVSFPEILHKIMQHQMDVLDKEKRKQQDLFHSDFLGRHVELECPHCRENLRPDQRPRWSTRTPGTYFRLQQRCYSAACKNERNHVTSVPRDENILSVADVRAWSRQKQSYNLDPYLLDGNARQHIERPLPSSVLICCTKCRETLEEDTAPTFTRGRGNPLYVSHRRSCNQCRYQTNFVPVDDTKFIRARQLYEYMQRWTHLGKLIIDILLQWMQPSESSR